MSKAKMFNTAQSKAKKMVSIRNKSAIHRTAYLVCNEINRGQATIDKIQTVLGTLRYENGVRNIQKVDTEKIEQYLQSLVEKVEDGDLSRITAATYVSALNTVLKYADRNDLVISAKAYGLSKGSHIYTDLSNPQSSHEQLVQFLESKANNNINYQMLSKSIELQRQLGLRFRESVMIKDRTIASALKTGILHLGKQDGTKNSRIRDIKLSGSQKVLLQETRDIMKNNRQHSLIDTFQKYEQYKNWAYRQVDNFRKATAEAKNYHFHGERHFYAHQRYEQLWETKTGIEIKPPVLVAIDRDRSEWNEYVVAETGLALQEIKDVDKEIRLVVSAELGHGRLEVTRAYLG